jgi:hypothetical protein
MADKKLKWETLHVGIFETQDLLRNHRKEKRLQTRYAAARIDPKELPLERIALL